MPQSDSLDRTPVKDGRKTKPRKTLNRPAIKVYTDLTGPQDDRKPLPSLIDSKLVTPQTLGRFFKDCGVVVTVVVPDRILPANGNFEATIRLPADPDELAASIARQLPNTRRAQEMLDQVRELKRRINRTPLLRRQIEAMLDKTVACTTSEITRRVLAEYGLSDQFDLKLAPGRAETPREFCQQTGEFDYDFLRQLWREEGWSFCFRIDEGGDRLLLTDHAGGWPSVPGEPVSERRESSRRSRSDAISAWRWQFRRSPQGHSEATYDFTRGEPRTEKVAPGAGVLPSVRSVRLGEVTADDLSRAARVGARRNDSAACRVHGRGTIRTFAAGHTFFRAADGKRYLLTRVRIDAQLQPGPSFRCWFEAVPAGPDDPDYLGESRIEEQRIVGAYPVEVVEVGDRHDRVRLRMPWMSQEERTGWCGATHPADSRFRYRPGRRVLVEFLDGRPDRPVVIGQLGHAGAEPFDPDAEPEVSGFQTLSHALTFDDTASDAAAELVCGGEMSQSSVGTWNTLVGGDDFSLIAGDSESTVGGDAQEVIKGGWTQFIGKNARLVAEGTLDLRGRSAWFGGDQSGILVTNRGVFIIGPLVHIKPPDMSAPASAGRSPSPNRKQRKSRRKGAKP